MFNYWVTSPVSKERWHLFKIFTLLFKINYLLIRRTPKKMTLVGAREFCRKSDEGRHLLTLEDILELCNCCQFARVFSIHGKGADGLNYRSEDLKRKFKEYSVKAPQRMVKGLFILNMFNMLNISETFMLISKIGHFKLRPKKASRKKCLMVT